MILAKDIIKMSWNRVQYYYYNNYHGANTPTSTITIPVLLMARLTSTIATIITAAAGVANTSTTTATK